eukprot:gene10975-19814_t
MDDDSHQIYENRETINRHMKQWKPKPMVRPPGLGQEDNGGYDEEEVYVNKDCNPLMDDTYIAPVMQCVDPKTEEQERYEPLNVEPEPKKQTMRTGIGYEVPSPQQGQVRGRPESWVHLETSNTSAKRTTDSETDYDDVVKHTLQQKEMKTEKEQQAEKGIELKSFGTFRSESDIFVTRKKSIWCFRFSCFIGVTAFVIALCALVIALLLSLSVLKPKECGCQKEIDFLKAEIRTLRSQIPPTSIPWNSESHSSVHFKTQTLTPTPAITPFGSSVHSRLSPSTHQSSSIVATHQRSSIVPDPSFISLKITASKGIH